MNRAERGAAKREQILEAAMATFAEVGFYSASLREIAARSGISHPGLLHHFPSKEALLQAVLDRREHQDTDRFRGSPTGLGILRGIVALVEDNARNPGLVELYVSLAGEATSPSHPAHAYFRSRYAQIRRAMRHAFHRAREEGALRRDVDVESAALQLIALLDGLQLQWLLAPDEIDMAGLVQQHLDGLLREPLDVAVRGDGPAHEVV